MDAERCYRCGSLVELPYVFSGKCTWRSCKEVPLCIDCVYLRERNVKEFWRGAWDGEKRFLD